MESPSSQLASIQIEDTWKPLLQWQGSWLAGNEGIPAWDERLEKLQVRDLMPYHVRGAGQASRMQFDMSKVWHLPTE